MARLKSDYITKYYVDYVHTRLSKKYGLSYPQIQNIIRMYHDMAKEDYTQGEPVYLKAKLGNLQLYKEKKEVYVNEKGEVVNELPINFRETKKLWESKPELKHKTYVRYINKHSDGFVFKTSYQISKANYKYKNIYNFQFTRTLKSQLHKNIMEGTVDAFVKKY